ncbi:MAG: ABC transporter ATP-binding protein [Clostridia bacterium]|nr:ABC transporter ATP-binding protein [Clostridia bacterium]
MIKANGIRKIYKNGKIEVEALKGVDLLVEKGEFVSIMGASGSGKSTMMNILGCLDTMTSGKYFLDGEDISKTSGNKLAYIRNKKIGFVFQSFNLLPKLTAIQNVELPMIYGGVKPKERHEKALEAMKKVGLAERINHKPNEMSGGQRQRVAIARSLVNDPAIILADEPTGNLDSKSSVEIIEIFQKLNFDGATIVMVTHEPDIAAYTKRIVKFTDGIIISDEPVKNPLIAEVSRYEHN